MRRAPIIVTMIFVLLTAFSCKERYDAQLKPTQSNYLVVEGFINAQGSTKILLSRTVPLKDSSYIKPELKAQVTITGQDNSVYNVKEIGNGTYISDAFNLNINQKYRLNINTSAGSKYLSEFVTVKKTPAIDSVSWTLNNGAVQIYVNTHDPLNQTRYYKWDYEETWEIHSAFPADYVYNIDSGKVLNRSPASDVPKLYYCWQSQNSANILIGSSAKLAADVISLQPMVLIPKASIKTSVRYSILVNQYSLDLRSYSFYQQMKNSTESLGSIFDPLPTEATGNITCVSNPNERVIGYITASTVQQKRIFITNADVASTYSQGCETTLVANRRDSMLVFFVGGGLVPYAPQYEGPSITHYYSSSLECIDCRLRGTNVRPSFW